MDGETILLLDNLSVMAWTASKSSRDSNLFAYDFPKCILYFGLHRKKYLK